MKVDETKCLGCHGKAFDDDNHKAILMIEGCHHLFHETCFHEKILASLDGKDLSGGMRKVHQGICFETGCQSEFSFHLKRIAKAQGRTYEVIKLGEVLRADQKLIKEILKTKRSSSNPESTKLKKNDLVEKEIAKKSVKKASMILACVMTATLAAVLFHSVTAVAIAVTGTLTLGLLAGKVIDLTPKIQEYFKRSNKAPAS